MKIQVKRITLIEMLNDVKFSLHLIKKNKIKSCLRLRNGVKGELRNILTYLNDMNIDSVNVMNIDCYVKLCNDIASLQKECEVLM